MISYSFLLIGKVETDYTNPHHNADPNFASGQINIGMFQLSDKPSKIDAKWDRSFGMGKRIYEQKCGKNLPDDLSMTQKAIIAHVGFIYNERGGAGTLAKIGETRDEETLKGLLINKVQGAVVSMNAKKYGRLIDGNELAA